ncbi:hypothetical protein A7U60_g2001 [Sanghuangporus baumii]|uniref:Protein kinase domain-containing protein n=1 Tax=Sanghuangporus baumii TaxID=108892 RepID=A0A9Q5I3Z6_SANBA|nr:hypothetical protein A7U60_g2001 [Sanghuangporus baumii]
MNLKKIRHRLFFSEPFKIDWSLYDLAGYEIWWRDRYSLFESQGYRLRDRLRPGWIPSWASNPKRHPEDHEDTASSDHPFITEATRISDGSYVIIKRIKKNSDEKSIATYLSSLKDPRNHCVPIIDSFPDETEDGIEFLVMPLLRMFNCPSFHSVNEVVGFIKQTLEGISFMHYKNVAHRDCSDLNIMLDGTAMFPEGFHPIRQIMNRSSTTLARYKSRSNSSGVKYYFIDFGLSTRFDDTDGVRSVTGRRCQVQVPELSDKVPYDPFAVDIYLLGDAYMKHFIEKYSNVQFLKPLVESMTRKDPSKRPKADDALKKLEHIISQKSKSSLRRRLIKSNVGETSHFFLNVSCIIREGIVVAKRMTGTN